MVGGLQNATPKNDHKKVNKNHKKIENRRFWVPPKQGKLKGRANFSSLFWFQAPLGQPWGPQDPSGALQTLIFDDF